MVSTLADVQTQYDKDKNLRKEDVKALLEWAHKQPHLPKINELQAILFLHSCNYRNELAKTTMDTFFTGRTLEPDVFRDRGSMSTQMQQSLHINLITALPKKTPEGYTILFTKLLSPDSENYNFLTQLKLFDMVCMLHLYQDGISEGHVFIADASGLTLGHVTKMGPFMMKRFLLYVQVAMPVRLRQIHFHNTTPIMGKLVALMKPFLKQDLIDILHLHETLDSLTKFIPLECLPKDYGGGSLSVSDLHENIKDRLEDNKEFFEWEEKFVVDESKRIGKMKNGDIFGIDGTFRKLEID